MCTMQPDESLPEDLRNVSVYRSLTTEYMKQASPSLLPIDYDPVTPANHSCGGIKILLMIVHKVLMVLVFC